MKVVIPYARNRIAYSILRSLSNLGHECYVTDSVMLPMSRFSRYSKGFIRCPDYVAQPHKFVEWSRSVSVDYTIFPTFEESWLLRKFGYFSTTLPSSEVIEIANNKWEVHKLCVRLGIPTPSTILVNNVVVKPTISRGSKNCFYLQEPTVVQDRVYGEPIGIGMLFNRGSLKAQFAWKRLVEYPASGGTSVIRESILAPKHCEYAKKLLEHLEWHGPAMVEFKGDYVLEINPRFWGSLHLAVSSGVNFPSLMLNLMTIGDCDTVLEYEIGKKVSWLAGCLRRFRRSEGITEDFSLADPLPFFTQFLLPLRNSLLGRGLVLDYN